jgi:putative ABC transport system permease protein
LLGLAVRNLTARKLRALSTALAVFFGVSMVAGTLMLSDSVNRTFDEVFAETTAGIDVTVRPRVEVEGEFGEGPVSGLDASLLDRVRGVDGVESAEGSIGDPTITILDENGDRIGPPQGGPPHIAVSELPAPFESLRYVEGAPPSSPNQVAIDSIAAEEEGFEVGDRVLITGPAGARRYEISGIPEFGGGTPLGGATLAQFTLGEAQRLTGKRGRFDEIDVEAAEGTSPDDLAAAVAAAMPANVEVRTGAQTAEEDASDIKEGFSFLTTALLIFAGIAVFVGAFLIFNTFSITVAQRVRDFAMMRTLGASARQVLASVLAEAVLIGALASALGIAGGVGFVQLIIGLFSALGFELGTSGLALSGGTVAVAFAVGIGATLLSALVPGLRATRVAPLEALREGAGAQLGAGRRGGIARAAIAGALSIAGVAAVLVGLFAAGEFGTALWMMGAGLVLLFVGVAMLGGGFVRPIASVLGWPIERLRGVTGHLARENAQRHPARTATTAAALMIGVALVVSVGVLAESIRASIDDTLDRQFAGDVAIVNTDGFSPIPSAVAGEVREVEGVGAVSPIARVPARLDDDGDEIMLTGFEPATVADVANLDWAEGSDDVLADLGRSGALVEEGWAKDNDVGVGDRLELTGTGGDRIEVTVEGSVNDRPGLIVDTVAVSRRTVRARLGARDDIITFVGFTPEADPEATRKRIDRLLESRFPNAEARSQQELKDDQAADIDQLLTLIYAMLGLSVIVSVFGVVNTLSLTILERTRELAMLRAIGTSRSQVRRMIRYESVITALLGAIVGAAIGLGLGVAAVEALKDEGLILSIPVSLPVIVLVLGIVIGILAAIRPARRASRLNVIESLQYE